MKEHSAGGVVIKNGQVLMLKKYYGDWVLPKGKMERGENTKETAVREVKEETGIEANILKKVGYAKYVYTNQEDKKVYKRVDYYLMEEIAGKLVPQKEEGFCQAEFIDYKKAVNLLKHDSERNMVINAMSLLRD
mgnify:FL=1